MEIFKYKAALKCRVYRAAYYPSHKLLQRSVLVQGAAQCCVTGPAFEHMLQLGDLSLLETVMRNVVVFSRMKPHQKGQVMDLLSTRGLHHICNDQQQHLPVSSLLTVCLGSLNLH